MSQPRSPSPSSSSTLIVSPLPLTVDAVPRSTKKPDLLKADIDSYSGWFCSPEVDKKRMSGKGFIEPHRSNLPRRKRRVVTAPVDRTATAVHGIEKTLSDTLVPTLEAGPPFSTNDGTPGSATTPIRTQPYASSSSSSSVQTNITEPPSSPLASPTLSIPPQLSPPLSRSSTTFVTYPTFQTPKRALFHGHHLDDDVSVLGVTTQSPPPVTPTKGHLEPTSATLPRRHRSVVLSIAREREQRRRSIAEQQTTLAAQRNQKLNDAWKEVGTQKIKQTRADAEITNSESQSMRQTQSMCSQELAKGLRLGFLTEGDDRDQDENIVQINVYDGSTTPFSSPRSPSSPSSSKHHLHLPLPTNPLSYTDGTTSLTNSQIQQACTFIDEQLSVSNGRVSVLVLAPRMRPEEAMSIGVSYLVGRRVTEETDGDKASGDNDGDHSYSTVHRLLMAFHDDPGSPNPNHGSMKRSEVDNNTSEERASMFSNSTFAGLGCGWWRGLRPEWRGVLSFDGMQRLDKVWTKRS